jgi:hypothetical protein
MEQDSATKIYFVWLRCHYVWREIRVYLYWLVNSTHWKRRQIEDRDKLYTIKHFSHSGVHLKAENCALTPQLCTFNVFSRLKQVFHRSMIIRTTQSWSFSFSIWFVWHHNKLKLLSPQGHQLNNPHLRSDDLIMYPRADTRTGDWGIVKLYMAI